MRWKIAALVCGVVSCAPVAVGQTTDDVLDAMATCWTGGYNLRFNLSDRIYFEGDELGYAANGVGDVDGDGYADVAVGWYRAEVDDDSDDPVESQGFIRVFSGRDGSQIGDDITGVSFTPDYLLGHRLHHMHDINGDGRADLLVPSGRTATTYPGSTFDKSRGELLIYSYTDQFNASGTNDRWVPLVQVIGEADDRLGQGAIDAGDLNGDGTNDVVISAYQANTPFLVAVLMPEENGTGGGFWNALAGDWDSATTRDGDGDGLLDGGGAGLPIIMESTEYSIKITAASGEFGNSVTEAGDLDGDGEGDLIATHVGNGESLVYLSTSRRRGASVSRWSDLSPRIVYTGTGDGYEIASATSSNSMDIGEDEHDIRIAGRSASKYGQHANGTTGGVDFGGPTGEGGAPLLDYANTDLQATEAYIVSIQEFVLDQGVDPGDTNSYPSTSELLVEWDNSDYVYIIDKFDSPTGYGGPLRADVAGDTDGDGVMELMTILYQNIPNGSANDIAVWSLVPDGSGGYEPSLDRMIKHERGVESTGQGEWNEIHGSSNQCNATFNRLWPAWDVNGDGLDDLLLAAARYPLEIGPDGVDDPCYHHSDGSDCNGDGVNDPPHYHYSTPGQSFDPAPPDADPLVRVGRVYLVLSGEPSITAVVHPGTSDSVFEQGFSGSVTITGTDLAEKWGSTHTWSVSDLTVALENPLSCGAIGDVTFSGTGTVNGTGTAITGFSMSVDSDAGCSWNLTLTDPIASRTATAEGAFSVVAPPISTGDLDGDGVTGRRDLATLIANWGDDGASPAQGDVNGDGVVDGKDLEQVLRHWSEQR